MKVLFVSSRFSVRQTFLFSVWEPRCCAKCGLPGHITSFPTETQAAASRLMQIISSLAYFGYTHVLAEHVLFELDTDPDTKLTADTCRLISPALTFTWPLPDNRQFPVVFVFRLTCCLFGWSKTLKSRLHSCRIYAVRVNLIPLITRIFLNAL